MNYTWQLQGNLAPTGVDYSRDALPNLDEAALSEVAGLDTRNDRIRYHCPDNTSRDVADGPNIDWNCNGTTDGGTVGADINDCGARCPNENGLTVLGGADDDPLIRFDGGAVGADDPPDLAEGEPAPAAGASSRPRPARLPRVVRRPDDLQVG